MPKTDPLQNQRLGRRGETRFANWCADTRILPQKSDPDQLGWDYLVEIEPTLDDTAPLDREVGLIKALVQVKSTDKKSNTVRASLSSLKRLVDADLPAFVVHIDFSGQAAPRRARLLHIWKTQITNILKAIRVAEKKGGRAIHDVEVRLSLEEASEIVVDGANLKNLFLSHVPSSPSVYVHEKAGFRRACGWDENSIIANLRISAGQGRDALVDLLIGNLPEIELDGAIVDKRRFGISLDKDIDQLTRGTLKVEVKPLRKARAIVSTHSIGAKAEMEVDVFAPGIPNLPSEYRKLRVANDYLDVTLHFGTEKGKMIFHIDPEKRLSIHELSNALAFGVALSQDQAKLKVDFGDFGSQSFAVPTEAKAFSRWSIHSEFAEFLSIGLFRRRRSAICEITLTELQECLKDNMGMFAILSRPGFKLTFSVDDGCPAPFPTRGAIVAPVCIEFGDFAYVAVVKAECGDLEVEDQSVRFVGAEPSIVEDTIIDRQAISITRINQRVSEIAKLESSEGRCIVSSEIGEQVLDYQH